MTDKPRHDPLLASAAKGVEALHQIIDQRDKLTVENERMRVDIATLQERARQLETRLDASMAERDHYMRYATEITGKLNDIQLMVTSSLEAAKHVAYRPALVPVPKKTVTEISSDNIEGLIARLPQNLEKEKTGT